MYDRNVEFPNRYQLVKVDGTDDIFDLVPAPGRVDNDGTLINKNTLLKDATAALYGLGADAVPDDVLGKLSDAALFQRAKMTIDSKPVGSSMFLNVDGVSTEFMVVHKGNPDTTKYDASCDGVWLLQKDTEATERAWNSSSVNNDYENSTIHSYLNTTYLAKLDASVQSKIKQVKIPYRPGNGGSTTVNNLENGLSCKVFLLSDKEVGSANGSAAPAGSKLDYFVDGNNAEAYPKRKANNPSGAAAAYWLRTPLCVSSAIYANKVEADGTCASENPVALLHVRPCIILPNDYVIGESPAIVDVLGNLIGIPGDQIVGGVKIETGSYVGTGTKGQADQTAITLPFAPKLFVVNDSGYLTAFIDGITYTVFRNNPSSQNYIYYTISDNGISWYNEQDATYQLNTKATTYYYIAIG